MQPINAHTLAELIEFGEAGAFDDIFAASPVNDGQRVAHITGATLLIAPSMPVILFNRVLGLGLRAPIDEGVVKQIAGTYRDAGVKQWAIQIAPNVLTSATEMLFAAHGLRRAGHWEKVYRAASSDVQVKTDFTVRRIGVEMAKEFAEVCVAAFGMHPSLKAGLVALVGRRGWQHCMAFDGALPVACGSLFVNGKVGWLGMGGTLPTHRRRGAQGEIMAMRVRAAHDAGCAWVITETGADTPEHPNPSFHNMLRTGFLHAYQRPEFIFEAG
jgi:hypothetical protein